MRGRPGEWGVWAEATGMPDRAGSTPASVLRLGGAALGQLRAVWVVGGLAVALFGLVPRSAAAARPVLVAVVVTTALTALGLAGFRATRHRMSCPQRLPVSAGGAGRA